MVIRFYWWVFTPPTVANQPKGHRDDVVSSTRRAGEQTLIEVFGLSNRSTFS